MSLEKTLSVLFSRLPLPQQNLSTLSFCQSTKAADVKSWAESLPATRISFTSVQLYAALPELARLKTDPNSRLAMLESVRPYVQQCIQGLGKHFLNQPIILPDGAVKSAIVAQALQRHIANGYIVAARDIALQAKKKTNLSNLDIALQRAINGLALILMRGYQLYTPTPSGLWLELHSLYQVAQAFERTEQLVLDPRLHHSPAQTIQQTYLRALLLACARPNQLRQLELDHTFNALEIWTSFAATKLGTEEDRLFAIDPCDDLPPVYKTRMHSTNPESVFELELEPLVSALQRQLEVKDGDGSAIIKIPNNFPQQLLEHLCSSWTVMRQRAFERRLTQGELHVTLGLTSLHYHCAGEIEFKDFLQRHSDKPAESNSDAEEDWTNNKPPLGSVHDDMEADFGDDWDSEPEPELQVAPVYSIRIVDVSPGGYCLEWAANVKEKLRAGDLIGVREAGRIKWSIATIRWIRQAGGITQLGVQVIAPQARATSASMVQKTGEKSPLMRALKLQPLKSVNQPATLITDKLPFTEYCKVSAMDGEGVVRMQLTKRIFATGSFSQFSYRLLDAVKGTPQASDDDFSAVWQDK